MAKKSAHATGFVAMVNVPIPKPLFAALVWRSAKLALIGLLFEHAVVISGHHTVGSEHLRPENAVNMFAPRLWVGLMSSFPIGVSARFAERHEATDIPLACDKLRNRFFDIANIALPMSYFLHSSLLYDISIIQERV